MCERRLFLFCFVLLLVILDPVYTPESMIPNSQTRKKEIDSLQNWFLTYISFNGSQKRFFFPFHITFHSHNNNNNKKIKNQDKQKMWNKQPNKTLLISCCCCWWWSFSWIIFLIAPAKNNKTTTKQQQMILVLDYYD